MPSVTNKTNVNAMQDDDGSGQTGTVVDKQDFLDLLESVDSMVANTSGFSIGGPFTANGAITANGALTANGGLTIAAGIIFPATQVPSADVSCLDDFVKGTWTPNLLFGGANTGLTYSSRKGTYTKIGNIVVAECRVHLSAKGSSTGSASITGLPGVNVDNPAGQIDYSAGAANITSLPYAVISTSILFLVLAATGSTGRVNMTDTHFTNSSDVRINITYLCAN